MVRAFSPGPLPIPRDLALNLVKAGTGLQVLSGVNTYTGSTTISGGTLAIGGAGQLGGGSYAANIANNGAFVYNSAAAQTLSGVISGPGTLTQNGPGLLVLCGTNTFTGNITISGGTLQDTISENSNSGNGASGLGNPATAGRTVTINQGGTLAFGVPRRQRLWQRRLHARARPGDQRRGPGDSRAPPESGQHLPGERNAQRRHAELRRQAIAQRGSPMSWAAR